MLIYINSIEISEYFFFGIGDADQEIEAGNKSVNNYKEAVDIHFLQMVERTLKELCYDNDPYAAYVRLLTQKEADFYHRQLFYFFN